MRWRSALVPHVQQAKTQCRRALVQHGHTATTMLNLKQLRSLCVCMCSQGSICTGQRHACTANIESCEHKYISHIGRNSFSWDLTTANTATNPATECVSLATRLHLHQDNSERPYTYTLYYTLYTVLYTYTLYLYLYLIILYYYTLYLIHISACWCNAPATTDDINDAKCYRWVELSRQHTEGFQKEPS